MHYFGRKLIPSEGILFATTLLQLSSVDDSCYWNVLWKRSWISSAQTIFWKSMVAIFFSPTQRRKKFNQRKAAFRVRKTFSIIVKNFHYVRTDSAQKVKILAIVFSFVSGTFQQNRMLLWEYASGARLRWFFLFFPMISLCWYFY